MNRLFLKYKSTNIFLIGILVLLVGAMLPATAAEKNQDEKTPNNEETLLQTEFSQDSLYEKTELEEILYSIKLLRLEDSLANISPGNQERENFRDVFELKADAEKWAQKGGYLLANILLDGALQLLRQEENLAESDVENLLEEPGDLDNINAEDVKTKNLNFKKEVGFGVEFSRQQFGLALGEQDSTFLETKNNPFYGLRFGFDYGSVLQLEDYFKYSRDYISNELLFNSLHGVAGAKQIHLENRIQGTFYRRDSNLKYLQEELILTAEYALSQGYMIHIQNEFSVRKYQEENEAYPDYSRDYLKVRFDCPVFSSSKMGLGYRFQWQGYPTFQEYDYNDHVFELAFSKISTISAGFFIENKFQKRNYSNVVADSSYWDDYSEDHLRLEIWHRFGSGVIGRLENEFRYRRNRNSKISTPDFIYGEMKPSLSINFGGQWTLTLAPVFCFQKHFSRNSNYANIVEKENYYSPGLSISIDFLNLEGLMFSLSNTYEWRRFPESGTKGIEDFSLYSDRNVNSLLFYLSWELMNNVEFAVIANYDDDRDKKKENADSKSTIFSVELNYRF